MLLTTIKSSKLIRYFGSLIILYAIFGFYFLPLIVKPQVLDLLSDKTNLTVNIDDIDINPFTLSVSVDGFHAAKSGYDELISFQNLTIDLQILPLLSRTVSFDNITLIQPVIDIEIAKSGELSLDDLLKEDTTNANQDAENTNDTVNNWILSINKFNLEQGAISFADNRLNTPFKQLYKDINITLNNFSTKPNNLSQNMMKASTDRGTVISWQGEISLFPFTSTGKVTLFGGLKVISDYFQDTLLIKIDKGNLNIVSEYKIGFDNDTPSLALSNTSFEIDDLAITQVEDNKPLIGLTHFGILLDEFDLNKKLIKIDKIESDGIQLLSTKDKLSNFSLADLLVLQNLKEQSQDPSTPSSADTLSPSEVTTKNGESAKMPQDTESNWEIFVNEVAPLNTQITIIDTAYQPNINHRIDIPNLSLTQLQLKSNESAKLSTSIIYNQQSTFDITGSIVPKNKNLDLNVSAEKIELTSFQHILGSVTNLAIKKGLLSSQFTLQVNASEKIPTIEMAGNAQLEQFEINNNLLVGSNANLFNFKAINIDSFSFLYPENKITIDTVKIDEPTINFSLDQQANNNFKRMLKENVNIKKKLEEDIPGLKQAIKYEQKADPFHLNIEKISLSNAKLDFKDQSVKPEFNVILGDLHGRINKISSEKDKIANIKFKGLINQGAPLSVSGTLKPLDHKSFSDLIVNIKDVSLPALSSYSGKYAGYKLKTGLLHIKQHHKIKDSRLSSENYLTVENMNLGESVKSEDATSLPVGLAISLLKDREGNIELDLPMSGDLDNPDFRYGGVVLGALGSVITSTVSSPFNVLGKLIGADDSNLGYITFNANSSLVTKTQQEKLDSLAKALILKPNFMLTIQGVGSAIIDKDEIAYASILTQLSIPVKTRDKNLSKQDETTIIEHYLSLSSSPVNPEVTFDEAINHLINNITIEQSVLLNLGQQRAVAIEQYLLNNTKVNKANIKLLESTTKTDKKNLHPDSGQIKIIFSLLAK